MSHQADTELPEHVIDLGHQLLSFHQAHNIRKPEFRALTRPFQTKYPTPEPAPAYPPDWLTSDPTLKAAISRFVVAAEPILTTQPPSRRPISLQPGLFRTRPDVAQSLFTPTPSERARSPVRPVTRDTSTTFEYEINRNPDDMALSQQTLDAIERMI